MEVSDTSEIESSEVIIHYTELPSGHTQDETEEETEVVQQEQGHDAVPTLVTVTSMEVETETEGTVPDDTATVDVEGGQDQVNDDEKKAIGITEAENNTADSIVVNVDPSSITRLSSGKIGFTKHLAGYWEHFTPIYNSDGMVISATCKTCLFSFSPRPFCLEAHLNGNNRCRAAFGGESRKSSRGLALKKPKEEVKDAMNELDELEMFMALPPYYRKLKGDACFICGNSGTRRRTLEAFGKYPEDWGQSISKSLCNVLDIEEPAHRVLSCGMYCQKCAQLLRDINWVHRSVSSLAAKLGKLRDTVARRIESYYASKEIFAQNLKSYEVSNDGEMEAELEVEVAPEIPAEDSEVAGVAEEPEEHEAEAEAFDTVADELQAEPDPVPEDNDATFEDDLEEKVEIKIEATSDHEVDPAFDEANFDQTDIDWVPVVSNPYKDRLRKRKIRFRGGRFQRDDEESEEDEKPKLKPRVKETKKKKQKFIQDKYVPPAPVKVESTNKWNTLTIRCSVPSCKRLFSRPCKAEIHYRKDHENDPEPYHCTIFGCGAKFNYRTKLEAHRKTHTEDKILAKSVIQSFPCVIENCNRVFKDRRLLNHHVQNVHHPKLNFLYCQYCSKSFSKLSKPSEDVARALQEHEALHVEIPIPFTCVLDCGQSFGNSKDLKHHVAWEHDENRYRCSLCPGIAFVRKSSLRQHHRINHEAGPNVVQYCDFPGCTFSTSKYKNLASHAVSHSEERPFKCDQCPMAYKTKRNLQSHFAMIHSEATPYACQHCDLKFKSSRLLNIHEVSHTGTTIQHLCSGCGKGFRTLSNLTTHVNYRCPKGPAFGDEEILAHRQKCRENSRIKRAKWRQLYGYDRLPTGTRRSATTALAAKYGKARANKAVKIVQSDSEMEMMETPILVHVLPPVSEEVEIPSEGITWTTATVIG